MQHGHVRGDVAVLLQLGPRLGHIVRQVELLRLCYRTERGLGGELVVSAGGEALAVCVLVALRNLKRAGESSLLSVYISAGKRGQDRNYS